MKRLMIVAMLLAGPLFAAHAQNDNNDEYELRKGEKMGYIITQKGEKIEGIVKLAGTKETPWDNQKKVKFIPTADINPEVKRQKFKTMDADDIKEYVAIDEDGTERKFREVKYTNKRDGLTNSHKGLGGKMMTIKNLASTTHLAEVIVDGPISVYRLYGYPAPIEVSGGQKDDEENQRNTEQLILYPSFIYQKEDSKLKELTTGDFKDLVEDCKVVADKLAAGGYPSYDPSKEEKERSGLGKLAKNEVNRVGTKLAIMSKEVFSDYNATCGKK